MISSTNTVNINGTVLNDEELVNAFACKHKNDKFSRWVVRPLAALTVIGMGIAIFFASAFLVIMSLAIAPLLGLSFWAIKKKIQRDAANAELAVQTQSVTTTKPESVL